MAGAGSTASIAFEAVQDSPIRGNDRLTVVFTSLRGSAVSELYLTYVLPQESSFFHNLVDLEADGVSQV